ncbi:MAG: STAS domain-containing protein [Magnetococcales bacterium]|nr:STAS domain-containing protein [Magnetococcales bacterium]
MSITSQTNNNVVTIHIVGSFDYKMRTEFRKAYADKPPGTPFEIDFSRVSSVDSSALGMLLVLREQCGGDQANIALINCKPEIRHLFQISQFKDLFHLR